MTFCLPSGTATPLSLVAALLLLFACEKKEEAPAQDKKQQPSDLSATTDMKCDFCPSDRPLCIAAEQRCVQCLVDGDCVSEAVCVAERCIHPQCRTGVECLPGEECKDGFCVATCRRAGCDGGTCDVDAGLCVVCRGDTDCAGPSPACDRVTGRCMPCVPGNPGRSACGPTQRCAVVGGGPTYGCVEGCDGDAQCQALDPATRCCDHMCINPAANRDHCGRCGVACGQAFACCAGSCIDSLGDPRNCGACGNVCASPHAAVNSCVLGACTVGACDAGFADCNGDVRDGCEVDVGASPMHCGGCNRPCAAVPHATVACGMGACRVAGCDPGWNDCDGTLNNGCESNPLTDLRNCGGCRTVCPQPPNVAAACVQGACVQRGCNPGFTDCDNNVNNGCEADLRVDLRNCGACGVVCPAAPNATAACNAGVCALSCNAGFANCDNNLGNGCEVDIWNDSNNCGACGNVCPRGTRCLGGGVCIG